MEATAMSSTNQNSANIWGSFIVAFLAIIGGTATSVLSGRYQMETARAQIQKDVRIAQIQALIEKERLIREKYEALMIEVSDQFSYLNAKVEFPIAEVKDRLARCRRAAYALSAHASPPLSKAALNAAEAASWVFERTRGDVAVVAGIDRSVTLAAKDLSKKFEAEISRLEVQRRKLSEIP
jgi:hypothetical protein